MKERKGIPEGGGGIAEWSEYVTQSGLSFTDLTETNPENKPWHMALYVRFPFVDKGLRAEKVAKAVSKAKGLFWEEVWPDADLWDHALLKRAVDLAGRSNLEQRDNIAFKAMLSKYNMKYNMK